MLGGGRGLVNARQLCLNRRVATFARNKYELPVEDRFSLRTAVERDLPAFARRLDGVLEIEEIAQPFFTGLQVLEVVSAAPPPPQKIHLGRSESPRRLWVLTRHIEHLRAMAELERPRDLTDPNAAKEYALHATAWTTESPLGELRVASLDEVPWFDDLSDAERARVDELRRTLAGEIGPEKLEMAIAEYRLTYWLVANQRLIRRTLTVPLSGALRRDDRVVADQLPVPPGKIWKFVDGRLVPVG